MVSRFWFRAFAAPQPSGRIFYLDLVADRNLEAEILHLIQVLAVTIQSEWGARPSRALSVGVPPTDPGRMGNPLFGVPAGAVDAFGRRSRPRQA